MKDFDHYQAKDVAGDHAFIMQFIAAATFVDIDNVKEVVFTGSELQDIANNTAGIDGLSGWAIAKAGDAKNVAMYVSTHILKRDGGKAIEKKVTHLAETHQLRNAGTIGKLTFKSIDFDIEGFTAKTDALRAEREDRFEEFKKDTEEAYSMTGFSSSLKKAIHRAAWEEGHSSGLQEVYNCYDKFVEIADVALTSK